MQSILTDKTRHLPITLVMGLLAVIWTPFTAKASDQDTSSYLSSTTSNIGQASARQLPAGSGLNGGERQLAIGISNCQANSECMSVGLDYQYTRYEFIAINSRDRDLHRLQMPLTWAGFYAGRRLSAGLAPGIATSSNVMKDFLKRGSSNDLFVTGRLESQPADNQWGPVFGVSYDRAFGQDKLVPVIGLEHRSSANSRIRLAYPDSSIEYQLSNKHRLSWMLFPSGQRWHVVTDDFDNQFEYQVKGMRTQMSWQMQLFRKVSLVVAGGYEFNRRHVFVDDAGVTIDAAVDNSWSLSLGLQLGQAPSLLPHGYGYLQ